MAEWKKVIVSGSNPHINHITSSGNLSASGNIFAELTENINLTRVVVYNNATGQLEQKELNLVQTNEAPNLFLLDVDNSDVITTPEFKLSFDSGSLTQPITAPKLVSASLNLADGSPTFDQTNTTAVKTINETWEDIDITQQLYFSPTTNATSSVGTSNNSRRNALNTNGTSGHQTESIEFHLQAVEDDNTAVPGFDLTAAFLNYGPRAINNGGTGSLQIFVNNVETPARSIDLTANPGAISNTVNGITVNLFASQSNLSSIGGDIDINKHYRSGSFTVEAANSTHQVDGYNYAFVIHTGSEGGANFAHITNFVEWFYDIDGNNQAMVATAGATTNATFDSSDVYQVSGIKFFTKTSADSAIYKRRAKCTNQYRNVYNATEGISITMAGDQIDTLTVTQSGTHLSTNPTLTSEGTGNTEAVDLAALADTNQSFLGDTNVTASFGVTFDSSNQFHQPNDFITSPWGTLNDAFDLPNSITFENPNKTNKTANFTTLQDYMVNTLTSGSTSEDVYEQFRGEKYRVRDITYNVNDDPSSTGPWDGTKNIINGGTGFNGNNIIYHSYLVYPTKAGDNSDPGNFNPTLGPTSNVDYGTATGTRVYLRYFKVNSSQAGNKSINLEIIGDGKVVSSSNALTAGTNELHVFFQRLGVSGGTTITNSTLTSLIDTISPSVRVGAQFDSAGGVSVNHIPLASASSGAGGVDYAATALNGGVSVPTGVVAFSEAAGANIGVEQNEFVIVKIETPENWTGNIDAMAIRYGGFNDSTTPLLDSLGTK